MALVLSSAAIKGALRERPSNSGAEKPPRCCLAEACRDFLAPLVVRSRIKIPNELELAG